MEYTESEDGTPVDLTVRSAVGYSGSLDLAADAQGLEDLQRGLDEAGFAASESEGQLLEAEASLDLADPDNRAAAEDLIGALAPGTSPLELFEEGGELYERFEESGEIDVPHLRHRLERVRRRRRRRGRPEAERGGGEHRRQPGADRRL